MTFCFKVHVFHVTENRIFLQYFILLKEKKIVFDYLKKSIVSRDSLYSSIDLIEDIYIFFSLNL